MKRVNLHNEDGPDLLRKNTIFIGHLSNKKIGQVSNTKIRQMTDASGGFLVYNGFRVTLLVGRGRGSPPLPLPL